MNRMLLFLLFFSLVPSTFAQRQLRAYVDNKQFYAPKVGNYVEFNFQFVGYSLQYQQAEDGLMAELLVETSIENGDSVVARNMYRLLSPLMRDSLIEDFYEIQRFQLDPGNYLFNISLTDLNSTNEPLTATMPITVREYGESVSISDVQVAEFATEGDPNSIFFKSGYNIIPRLSTFYPQQLTTLPVYMEVYNAALLGDSTFRIRQTIMDAATGLELKAYENTKEYYANDVVPVFRQIQLDQLPTGKYILKYALLNENDAALASQRYEFERSNDVSVDLFAGEVILDPRFQESIPEDSVGYYLESLIPISRKTEVLNIVETLKTKNGNEARKHIQQYWVVTSGNNAYEEWLKYKEQVRFVEKIYGNNFQEGFETDRGRVYLQYGSPTNIISREVSDIEYPYEIWQYNKIGTFSNKRFVFYNPDLVNNAYRLLHSDMIGELKNNAWPQELSKRNTRNGGIDDPNAHVIDKWGQNSADDFRQY